MSVKIGINGFGRIGRNFFRAALAKGSELEIVAVNDLDNPAALAHLLKYDTVGGRLDATVTVEGDTIFVNGKPIKVLAERDPALLPWGELGVDVVIESTGRFTKSADARKHIEAGAKKVIVSAPLPATMLQRSCSESTRARTTQRSTTSSRTQAAPRTASRHSPRCSWTTSASSVAS